MNGAAGKVGGAATLSAWQKFKTAGAGRDAVVVIAAKAGLQRQDAGANAEGGPEGRPQEWPVIHFLLLSPGNKTRRWIPAFAGMTGVGKSRGTSKLASVFSQALSVPARPVTPACLQGSRPS